MGPERRRPTPARPGPHIPFAVLETRGPARGPGPVPVRARLRACVSVAMSVLSSVIIPAPVAPGSPAPTPTPQRARSSAPARSLADCPGSPRCLPAQRALPACQKDADSLRSLEGSAGGSRTDLSEPAWAAAQCPWEPPLRSRLVGNMRSALDEGGKKEGGEGAKGGRWSTPLGLLSTKRFSRPGRRLIASNTNSQSHSFAHRFFAAPPVTLRIVPEFFAGRLGLQHFRTVSR